MGADKGDCPGRRRPWFDSHGQALPTKRDVAPPVVTFGHVAIDQTGRLQNLEMMGQEVGSHVDQPTELGNGRIAKGQTVEYGQTPLVAESSMPFGAEGSIHMLELY